MTACGAEVRKAEKNLTWRHGASSLSDDVTHLPVEGLRYEYRRSSARYVWIFYDFDPVHGSPDNPASGN
jgi:hypothetical protein